MAIIRKGDKKAELNLITAAVKQSNNRFKASDKAKTKAGLAFKNKNNTSVTIDPSKITISKNKSGKVSASYGGDKFEGPISGSAVDSSKRRKKKALMKAGSGAIYPKSDKNPNGLIKKSAAVDKHIAEKLADSRKARKQSGK